MATLLTVSEIAQRTKLKEATIRRWILQKKIPTVRLGRSVRMREEDLDALIREGYERAVPWAPR